MIQVVNHPISTATENRLNSYQQKIDEITDYAQRVSKAKKDFAKRNKNTNRVFQDVRKSLTAMCAGSRRCLYCEDSCADEVEHIQPKDLYPEAVFVWGNYLYACGPCNGGKNNNYAILDPASGNLNDVTRKSGQPVLPPIAGQAALINPREENPFILIALDLSDTFNFVPFPGLTRRDDIRARYTIDVLSLNRDILPPSRYNAYGNYRARLREYGEEKDAGASVDTLKLLNDALLHLEHPTVWHEMKRQRNGIAELKNLFDRVPEALNW